MKSTLDDFERRPRYLAPEDPKVETEGPTSPVDSPIETSDSADEVAREEIRASAEQEHTAYMTGGLTTDSPAHEVSKTQILADDALVTDGQSKHTKHVTHYELVIEPSDENVAEPESSERPVSDRLHQARK